LKKNLAGAANGKEAVRLLV
jgi:hypothetical protein